MSFKWFTRKPANKRPKRRLPQRNLAPVEDIVEQGLMVADVAVRMSVKNTIILNALGSKSDYDEQQIMRMVREALVELADERIGDANHIALMRGEIRKTGYSSWSENDYGDGDNATLRHRQEVYEQVAQQLRERSNDERYLRETAERAREAAWHEIGDSLKEKASHPYYAGGSSEEYQRERDSRIELLIQRDLTELMSKRNGSDEPPTEKTSSRRRVFSKRADVSG